MVAAARWLLGVVCLCWCCCGVKQGLLWCGQVVLLLWCGQVVLLLVLVEGGIRGKVGVVEVNEEMG